MDVAPFPYRDSDRDADLRWWAANNYLTVGQIYLRDNPLLRRPLEAAHIKPRLLGHWGTSPGLAMIYCIVNRVICETGTRWLYITGPGHGGPALVAAAYMDGTYSSVYPQVTHDEEGLRQLFRRFSTPGGIPSHVSVQTPGSIHEGGELGYALAHAGGAAMDNPDLTVVCVVGDGEAETGPLSASWRLPSFLNPRRDGAVLPIVHLNGYKIAGPTVWGRSDDADVEAYLRSQGWDPVTVSGDDPHQVIADLYRATRSAQAAIAALQEGVRGGAIPVQQRHRWPAIILRTPKGWTGPALVDGIRVEGTSRAHQVPLAGVRENPRHLAQLEEWMRSYRPEDLFTPEGRLVAAVTDLTPPGDLRLSATPTANGGGRHRPLEIPPLEPFAVPVDATARGTTTHENTEPFGRLMRDITRHDRRDDGGGSFRLFCPDETASNRLQAIFEVTDRCLMAPLVGSDVSLSADGRVMEVLSEHLCQGWLEGYTLTGRHGVFATYEAFAMVSASMAVQHVKWLQHAHGLAWRTPVPSLNVLLTSTCWRNDHNGFSHQGPGLIDALIPLSPEVVRVWLPPDANTTLSIAAHCLAGTDHVNLIVVDKQHHLQYLTMDEAHRHCAAGAAVWPWAGNEHDEPDVILACAGDVATQETLAAAELLRTFTPDLSVRVVNVVDLMALMPENDHPHGFSDSQFDELFTPDRHVVFAFHGYPRAIHQLIHGRSEPGRFHVRGFNEQGTTTTPFDMLVLNRMSRFHLVREALRRSRRRVGGWDDLQQHCTTRLRDHDRHVRSALTDLPEIDGWRWSGGAVTQQV